MFNSCIMCVTCNSIRMDKCFNSIWNAPFLCPRFNIKTLAGHNSIIDKCTAFIEESFYFKLLLMGLNGESKITTIQRAIFYTYHNTHWPFVTHHALSKPTLYNQCLPQHLTRAVHNWATDWMPSCKQCLGYCIGYCFWASRA